MTSPPVRPDLLPSAELNLCLSRALLASQGGVTLANLRGPLFEDLRSLANELPSLDAGRLSSLALSLEALTDTQQLMLGYSRLFLTPPAPAPLNLGAYLDGALMGQSTQSILALYHSHGLERDPAFRDLPDHLSLNLQWLAWVYSTFMEWGTGEGANSAVVDAVTMLRSFTLPGLAGIRRKAIKADVDATTHPWRLLIEMTHHQLSQDLVRLESLLPASPPVAHSQRTDTQDALATFEMSEAPRERLSCCRCGDTFESDPVLAEMRQRLVAAGVSADHLAVCPGCQGHDSASPSLKPPGAKLKAWQ